MNHHDEISFRIFDTVKVAHLSPVLVLSNLRITPDQLVLLPVLIDVTLNCTIKIFFRYLPPKSIYISEMQKTYESTNDKVLPEDNSSGGSGNASSTHRSSSTSDPNESGYNSDHIFSTFEKPASCK